MEECKSCTKCGTIKPFSEYWGDNRAKDKKASECKDCARIRKAKWYQENLLKCAERAKQYRRLNKEQKSKLAREYREKNKDKIKTKKKLEYQQNKEKIKERARQNYYANLEQRREYVKQYHLNNRDKAKKWSRNWMREARKNPWFKLISNFRSAIYTSLRKRKETPSFKLLDYSINDLIKHLEKQFEDGMNWNNYGNKLDQWSVDHVIPISAFNFKKETDIDFKRCWRLSNLRPMWHIENLKKGSKIDRPFQPFFAF